MAFVAILTSVFVVQGPPQVARGDDLSDAIAQQQNLQKEIDAQKKQMAALAAQQTTLQGQINSTRDNLANVSQNLSQTESQIKGLKSQITTLQGQYDQTVSKIADLETQLKSIQAQEVQKQQDLDFRKDQLAKRLVAAYETSETSLLEQLLQSNSIADVFSDVSYYFDIGEADKALALKIEEDQKTLAELQATVEQTRAATVQLRDQQAQQRKLLDSQMAQLNQAETKLVALRQQIQQQLAQQQQAQNQLAQNKTDLAAAIAANGKAQSSLQSKIDQLVAARAALGGIPSQFSGSLSWPMGGAVSQPFGCTGFPSEPPYGNCAHFHQGIDLVAPCGTPIRAAGAGQIVFVGYNPYDAPPQAWIVVIAHARNFETWYAHMAPTQPAGIYTGAAVSRGQVVGYEASTGHSTGCHLHWMIEYNGQFVNPQLFV